MEFEDKDREELMAELTELRHRVSELESERQSLLDSQKKLALAARRLVGLGTDATQDINLLTALCGELLGGTWALYGRLEGDSLTTVSRWRAPEGIRSLSSAEGHICQDLITKAGDEILVIRDLENSAYAETDPNVKNHGLKTYIGRAIKVGEERVGSLCVMFQEDYIPSPLDKVILEVCSLAVGRVEQGFRAEEGLQAREVRYRQLAENSLTGIFIHQDGVGVYVNKTLAEMLEYAPDEMLGRLFLEAVHPDDREMVAERARARLMEEPSPPTYELRLLTKSGETIWAEVWVTLVEYKGRPAFMGNLVDISERKRMETALLETQDKLESILKTAPVGIGVVQNRVIREANDAFCYVTGYSREELIDASTRLLYPTQEDYDFVGKEKYDQIDKYGRGTLETRLKRKDGEVIDVLMSSAPLDPDDGTKGITFTILDITERKRAEEALSESEHKYRLVVDNATEVIFVIQEGKVVFANAEGLGRSGYSMEEFGSSSFLEFVHPDDREMVAERYQRRLSGEDVPRSYEARVLDSTGNTWWGFFHATMIVWEGRPAVLVFGMDISELKKVEEALKESESRYRFLAESMHDVVWTADLNFQATYVSPSVERILGFTPEETIEQSPAGQMTQQSFEKATRTLLAELERDSEDAVDLDRSKTLELDFYRKDGSTRCLEATISFIRDENSHPVGLYGLSRDITDRRLAEKALLESKEELSNVLDASPIGIGKSQGRKILWGNQAMLKLFGFDNEEDYLGKDTRVLYPSEEEYQRIDRLLNESLKDGTEVETEATFLRKDGSVFDGLMRLKVSDPSLPTKATVVAISDISHRKEIEEQLRRSQRMEAIGNLTGGIAHEFKNLLQIVAGSAEFLDPVIKKIGQGMQELDAIVNSTERATKLVRQLLTFSRKVDSEPEPVDLNELVRRTRRLLYRTIPKMVRIENHLDSDLKMISADAGQIEQILVNLAVNARDAMPEGGKLLFETRNVTLDDEFCKDYQECRPGQYALLMVSDTGHGMDRSVLEHVFEPFFTTKGLGEGSGLGLATVFGIVSMHGGHITCQSEPGKGTKFDIYFPATGENRPHIEETTEESEPEGGTETILMVDDELVYVALNKKLLAQAGYTILSANNGKEAIEIYQKEQSSISLVILDLIMPEMDGKQCLEELLKIDPEVKALIASGQDVSGQTKAFLETSAKGMVSKPFQLREMLKAVRRVIDET